MVFSHEHLASASSFRAAPVQRLIVAPEHDRLPMIVQERQAGGAQGWSSPLCIPTAACHSARVPRERPSQAGHKQCGRDQPSHQAVSTVERRGQHCHGAGRPPAAQQHRLRAVPSGLPLLLPVQPAQSRYELFTPASHRYSPGIA